jgi:hypothetical protein
MDDFAVGIDHCNVHFPVAPFGFGFGRSHHLLGALKPDRHAIGNIERHRVRRPARRGWRRRRCRRWRLRKGWRIHSSNGASRQYR